MVLRSLLDGEGNDEALAGRIVFAGRRNNLNVGVAVFQIEASNQIAVSLDTVGIVDVRGLEKAQPIGGIGLDDFLQPPARVRLVADKIDLPDAGLFTLVDQENKVHAIIRSIDDLRSHSNVEATVALVDFNDALEVGLDSGA